MGNSQEHTISTEDIWRELSDRLRQFILSKISSSADAEDVLQGVFVRIHENLDKLRDEQRLDSWVFQITRNAIVDFFRRGEKQEILKDPAWISEFSVQTDEENVNYAIAKCLASMLALLPEDQKRAVRMYEMEELSQKDIAERESISLSGAKSRIQRGRKKLQEILRDSCLFELDKLGNVVRCELRPEASCDQKLCS